MPTEYSDRSDAKLELDPSSTVFHYAFTLFEGMKAYRQEDGTVRLFRPDKNMARMNRVRSTRLTSGRKLMSRVRLG